MLALALKAPVSDYPEVLQTHERSKAREKIFAETIKIDLYEATKNIKCPTLIVHGDADDVVPLEQSQRLLQSLGSQEKELKVIKDGPHTMRGKPMKEAHRKIVNFFKKTLLK